MITIYTDGASRGNPGPGGWSAIVLSDKEVRELGGREDHTPNNRMELMAGIKALEFVSSDSEIEVHTDSEYVMKGMTTWIHNWKKKNWRTAGKKPVMNQDLWERLSNLSEGKDIKWLHVRGHAGVPLNERADVIATEFADNMNPSLYHGPRDRYK